MPDETQTYQTRTDDNWSHDNRTDGNWSNDNRPDEAATDEARAEETAAPEPEERAVGVASVPDEHSDAAEPGEPAAESIEPAAEPGEPAVPTQRIDAEETPHDDQALNDEAFHDEARDDEARDDVVGRDDAPVPAMAYQLADEQAATQDSAAHELMPGDVPEQQVSGLFDRSVADGFRDRWQRAQMRFVDDPKSAAGEAKALVDDVFAAAREALDKQRAALDGWQSGESGQPDDTERLRVAVRAYRDFLDRMLGL